MSVDLRYVRFEDVFGVPLDLNLVHIIYEVQTDEPLLFLPNLYDSLRRFENYFKAISSTQSKVPRSNSREEVEHSPHRSVFGQILSTDPDVVRRHQKPPLPFAFKIKELSHIASCIELSIVIAGSAIQHVSIFRRAIKLMLVSVAENSGVDVAVSGVWSLDYQGGRHAISSDSSMLVILSALEILQSPRHSDSVKILIESPLRLLNSGIIAHSFDFGLLLRSQLRRCSSLFAYYGDGELDMDYRLLAAAADRVTTLANSFNFRKPEWSQWGTQTGIVGRGEFGDVAEGILPLLTLGSCFNAGKGAGYGMGAYLVEVL